MEQIGIYIVSTGAIVSALAVLLKGVKDVYKFVKRQDNALEDIARIKKEQCLTFEGLKACLEGLEQLGCNHAVTSTKNKLEDWLNEQAHE